MSGLSVAMNAAGDTVIIGARLNDGNGDNAGHARVFTLTDEWVGAGRCRYRRRNRRRYVRLVGGDECCW